MKKTKIKPEHLRVLSLRMPSISVMCIAVYIVMFSALKTMPAFAGEGSGISPAFPLNTRAPGIPANMMPLHGETGVDFQPALQSSPFDDAGDNHTASQWLITLSNITGTIQWDSGQDTNNLTHIIVPVLLSYFKTHYFWQVRHKDNHGQWSEFSTQTWFETGLPVPPDITASDGEYTDRISIAWSVSAGADMYRVYRNDVDTTNGCVQISGDVSATNVTDNTVIPGIMYYYRVQAGKDVNWGELSSSDSAYARLSAPTSLNASDGTYSNRVVLTWAVVEGATAYRVYRNENDNVSNTTVISTTAATGYSDAAVTPGKKYYYWVDATATAGNSSISAGDRGYARFTALGASAWKYKDGKKVDVLKGKGIVPSFTPGLIEGWQIGLATMTADGSLTNFNGPFILENLKNKNKIWLLKTKKELIIKYKAKKDILTYKLWDQMPESKVVYIFNPDNTETRTTGYILNDECISGVKLIRAEPAVTTGWQVLLPVIINEE